MTQARSSPPKVLQEAAALLLRAERETVLFSRAAPLDSGRDVRELTRAVREGGNFRLSASAKPRVDLGSTRRMLDKLWGGLSGGGAVERILCERARELELEARMAESLFTPSLRELADERFASPDGERAPVVDALVDGALASAPREEERIHRTDDTNDPKSLISRLRRAAFELSLPLTIELRPDQLAVAATGEGIIAIRPGVLLSASASERVAAHELHGHALPRARALFEPWLLFRAGTAGAADHEEGRALVVESRRGLLGAERLHELALRHRAALSVKSGASIVETVRLVVDLGATLERAVELALRVHRGGGIAREIVYLPAYVEVKEAFFAEPGLERFLERGRIGLPAAKVLSQGVLEEEAATKIA